jgi:multidrug transporter EmrE-like cation transporter
MNIGKNSQLIKFWIPLLVAVLTYAISDLLLKVGNTELDSSLTNLFQGNFLFNLLGNVSFIIALCLAFFSKIVMGYVLTKNPLGISEGFFLAFSILITFSFGIWIFQESTNILNVIGLVLIIVGIFITYYYKISDENQEKEEIKSDQNI